ncbi:protein CHLOROPLAST ENHANCING STRESS TOLERANCE, chloroplastic isoform X2 [Phalaenopsis equestris]|uniref:protein CHLOROPLAST ENHANCING STRESS TOLERANCE, chloroplastic isoform X2 n=1 Tax=Phalaenopsis equestris TaxID=78828 RepID=UPI0009E6426A|nr:protein CHLOROPLAST ENHANCING STRESS TOLERANCE, chloroplastic isoform X2 [Phalaenopsis equestris]
MALRLPLSAFEAPPCALNGIAFRSLSPLFGSSILNFSPPQIIRRRKLSFVLAAIGKDAADLSVSSVEWDVVNKEEKTDLTASGELEEDASPEDLEYVAKIKRVLELLKKNRDMLFGEVKLTMMIEDPRNIERKRLLGIEDPDEVTRDDIASALEDVHEGRIPKNRVALRLLAEEMINWPDLEVEAPKEKRVKSLYAKATDTGVDPREAAKRLNIDWDSAADIEAEEEDEDIDVPPAVGYDVYRRSKHPTWSIKSDVNGCEKFNLMAISLDRLSTNY